MLHENFTRLFARRHKKVAKAINLIGKSAKRGCSPSRAQMHVVLDPVCRACRAFEAAYAGGVLVEARAAEPEPVAQAPAVASPRQLSDDVGTLTPSELPRLLHAIPRELFAMAPIIVTDRITEELRHQPQ